MKEHLLSQELLCLLLYTFPIWHLKLLHASSLCLASSRYLVLIQSIYESNSSFFRRRSSPILHGSHSLARGGERILLLPLLKVLYSIDGGPLPRGRACVMIHVVDAPAGVHASFPTGRKRFRPLPRRRPRVMIHVIRTILRK